MNMVKRLSKFIKRNWIAFWMVLALVSVSGVFVFARYNDNTNVVKRVVSTQKSEQIPFTSNLLSISVPQQIRSVSSSETGQQYFDISIYDYDLKNPGSEYPTDIVYVLRAEFYNGSGSQALTSEQIDSLIGSESVTFHAISGNNIAASSFLTVDKDTSSQNRMVTRTVTKTLKIDSFRVYLPLSMKDKNICLKITASPSGYPDLPSSIGGVFSIKTQSFITINGWHGDFNDDRSIPLSRYDGFNYCITGNGTSEGILYWNNTLVEPNYLQIDAIKKTGESISSTGNVSWVKVSLNSTNNNGRYDIQFYVMNAGSQSGRSTIDSMTWSQFADLSSGAVTFVETRP